MIESTHRTRSGFVALTVLAVLAFAACKREAKPAPAEPADTYRVRVEVVEIAGSGDSKRAILSHEAIDAFKNREGTPERMPPMKMAFGLAPGVDEAALTPGSKHEIELDVVYGREPTIRVTKALPLPADTALTLTPH
jgi:hypothetical protein